MKKFNQAAYALPPELSNELMKIDDKDKKNVQEIRLRSNKPLVLMKGNKACFLKLDHTLTSEPDVNALTLSKEALERCYRKLCDYSVHSNMTGLTNGFITINGGHRVGVCSTAVYKGNELYSVKGITSLNIRISREFRGASLPILNSLYRKSIPSVIVAGPPASGKTTILRDMAYQLGSGYENRYRKIVVVDERSEIAGVNEGVEINNVGINTDVLNGFSKERGIQIAVRTLSPDIIVCDEIGTTGEVNSIRQGFSSGVGFIVSVHISNENELYTKPQIHALLESNEFDYIVLLKKDFKGFEFYDAKEVENEIHRNFNDHNFVGFYRNQ